MICDKNNMLYTIERNTPLSNYSSGGIPLTFMSTRCAPLQGISLYQNRFGITPRAGSRLGIEDYCYDVSLLNDYHLLDF